MVFELVPTTSSEISEGVFMSDNRRNRGIWHIGRSQVHIRGCHTTPSGTNQTFRQDTANLKGGGLVQSTIAPVWKSAARHHSCLQDNEHLTYTCFMNHRTEDPDHNPTDIDETFAWIAKKVAENDKKRKFAMYTHDGEPPQSYKAAHASHTQTPTAIKAKSVDTDKQTKVRTGSRLELKSNFKSTQKTGLGMDITMTDVMTDEIIARRSSQVNNMETNTRTSLETPNKKPATTKTRMQRSIMDPTVHEPIQIPVQSQVVHTPNETGSYMQENDISIIPKTASTVDPGVPTKVYARSVNATSGDVSKSVSVARVSTKKRAEADT